MPMKCANNLLFLPYLCRNRQIWIDFNTFVIILGGKWGGGEIAVPWLMMPSHEAVYQVWDLPSISM